MAENSDPREKVDLEVFRVPPKEMLEKLSQSSASGQKPKKPLTSQVRPSMLPSSQAAHPQTATPLVPKPVSRPQQAQQKVSKPRKSFLSSLFKKRPKKEMSKTPPQQVQLSKQPQLSTRPVFRFPKSLTTKPSARLPRPSKRDRLFAVVFGASLALIIFLGLVVLEWRGVVFLGLSRIVGPPPAKWVWPKAVVFADSLSFSGKVDLEDASGDLSEWLRKQSWSTNSFSFSGELLVEEGALAGIWQWEKERPFAFYLKGDTLYLQREKENWQKIKLSFAYKGAESFINFLNNPTQFNRLKYKDGIYWYAGEFGNSILSLLGAKVKVNVGLDRRRLRLSDLRVAISDPEGLKVYLSADPTDASFLVIDEEELKEAQTGQQDFAALVDFTNIWIKQVRSIGRDSAEKGIRVRDEQRKRDLNILNQALQNYYREKGVYPKAETKLKIEESEEFRQMLESYLPEGQDWNFADPRYPDFYYGYISDGENYELSARLENQNDEEGVSVGGIVLYFVTSSESYNPSLVNL